MATWLKGCLVCNADLVTTVKELVAEGMTKNQVWDRLVEDQQEELGEVLYSKNALQHRFKRHTIVRPKSPTEPLSEISGRAVSAPANGSETLQEKQVAVEPKPVTVVAATPSPAPVVAAPAPSPPVAPAQVPTPAPTTPAPAMPNGYTPKFNRQSSDRIEWAAWSWNPVTGCLHNCQYCYARDIANRYPNSYPKGFKPHFRPERLSAPQNTPIPISDKIADRLVFTVSMGELFGKWVPQEWIDAVLDAVRAAPQWTFLFLTKNPERLLTVDFPPNCWVGATADTQARADDALECFLAWNHGASDLRRPTVLFLSIEPMREAIDLSRSVHLHGGSVDPVDSVDWIIVGGQSQSSGAPAMQPEWEWVENVLDQARLHGIPVFFKPNLTVRPRGYPEPVVEEDEDFLS